MGRIRKHEAMFDSLTQSEWTAADHLSSMTKSWKYLCKGEVVESLTYEEARSARMLGMTRAPALAAGGAYACGPPLMNVAETARIRGLSSRSRG